MTYDVRTITMAHGAGGKDSSDLMREVFGRHFANSVLDGLEDASPVSLPEGEVCVSTDSFVVTPVSFPGGDIGKLAVCGSVNDVLMMGATPKYLTCGYILEDGLRVETLDGMAASMISAAKDAGVTIIAGDTKVIERRGGASRDAASELMINTTCIGVRPAGCLIGAANAKPGDAVILSGTLGDHHAAILSVRMGIQNNIKSDCAVLTPVTAALAGLGADIHVMRDVTRGGLATVLSEIAASSGAAIEIEEAVIPVAAEVKAFCGIMGLDPLYMGNEGKLVAIVSGDAAEKALALMADTEPGRNARVIGQVRELSAAAPALAAPGPAVTMRTRLGGTRRVDMLIGEGLPRIC
jgi:hydrogenase expression/formation protein HypE